MEKCSINRAARFAGWSWHWQQRVQVCTCLPDLAQTTASVLFFGDQRTKVRQTPPSCGRSQFQEDKYLFKQSPLSWNISHLKDSQLQCLSGYCPALRQLATRFTPCKLASLLSRADKINSVLKIPFPVIEIIEMYPILPFFLIFFFFSEVIQNTSILD